MRFAATHFNFFLIYEHRIASHRQGSRRGYVHWGTLLSGDPEELSDQLPDQGSVPATIAFTQWN